MKRGRQETVGEAIEKIQAMRKKASTEAKRSKEAYVNETIKVAQSTAYRLTNILNELESKSGTTDDKPIIQLVDELFGILFENQDDLAKTESDYYFWADLDQKFNG